MSHLGQLNMKTAKARVFNLEKFAFQLRLPLMTNDTQLLLEEKSSFQSLRRRRFSSVHKRGISGMSVHWNWVGGGGGHVLILSNFVRAWVMCYFGMTLHLSGWWSVRLGTSSAHIISIRRFFKGSLISPRGSWIISNVFQSLHHSRVA